MLRTRGWRAKGFWIAIRADREKEMMGRGEGRVGWSMISIIQL